MDFWEQPTPYTVLAGGNKTLILRRKTPLEEVERATKEATETIKALVTATTQLQKAVNETVFD